MKKIFLRILAVVCLLVMLLTAVACQQNYEDAAKTKELTEHAEGLDEKITYTMFRNSASIQGYPEDGGQAKELVLHHMEKSGITGVDYKVIISVGDEYMTKLNAMAAAQNLPDYFSIDIPTMIRFANQGHIMPLDELVEKYAPNLTKSQRQSDVSEVIYNDTLWAITPAYRPEPVNGPNLGGIILRQDWLDDLGIKMPETLDELYNVLKAFVENDPNKTGKNDTVGITGSNDAWFLNIVFGAYGIVPDFWHEQDGRFKQGSVLPEAREVLTLLQRWHKEGLIDKEYPIMQKKQKEEKFINSKAGMLEASGLDVNTNSVLQTALKKITPTANLAFLIPPKGPKGKQGFPETAPGYGDIRCISAKTKRPDLLVKMIDWSVDDSENGGFYLVTYGVEDKNYTYDRENNRIKMLSDYNTLYNEGFSNPIRFATMIDRRWLESESALDAVQQANRYIIKNSLWRRTPAMIEYPDLKKLWHEYSTKIITGEFQVDAWDEYVQKYYRQGGKVIEDQVNEELRKENQ